LNTVKWPASADPTTASYKLQTSGDAATWVALATVVHAIPGANWDGTNSLFYYDDPAGSGATWYRVAVVSTLGVQGAWSAPLQAPVAYTPQWSTAGMIVNDAMSEIGLGTEVDPFTSTDPNFVQACGLLKSLGRDVVSLRGWSHLRGTHTFTTVAGQATYPLPIDFHSMAPQTGWDQSNLTPLDGPTSPEVWNYLQAGSIGVSVNVFFRVWNRSLSIYPASSNGVTISFEYNRSLWVSVTGSPDTLTSNAPVRASDICWFDSLLLVRGLKMMMLQAKGFDSTRASQEYSRTLELTKSFDTPAPVMSMTGGNRTRFRLLDGSSVSDTGFGS
jgi:hypothetical protein